MIHARSNRRSSFVVIASIITKKPILQRIETIRTIMAAGPLMNGHSNGNGTSNGNGAAVLKGQKGTMNVKVYIYA